MAMTVSEAEVARRLDAGQSPTRIARETKIARCVIVRVTGWGSVSGDRKRDDAIRQGSRDLLTAIQRAQRNRFHRLPPGAMRP